MFVPPKRRNSACQQFQHTIAALCCAQKEWGSASDLWWWFFLRHLPRWGDFEGPWLRVFLTVGWDGRENLWNVLWHHDTDHHECKYVYNMSIIQYNTYHVIYVHLHLPSFTHKITVSIRKFLNFVDRKVPLILWADFFSRQSMRPGHGSQGLFAEPQDLCSGACLATSKTHLSISQRVTVCWRQILQHCNAGESLV